MQVNDQVKVIKAKNPYESQAGVVTKIAGDTVVVKLDLEDDEKNFKAEDLQFLGR